MTSCISDFGDHALHRTSLWKRDALWLGIHQFDPHTGTLSFLPIQTSSGFLVTIKYTKPTWIPAYCFGQTYRWLTRQDIILELIHFNIKATYLRVKTSYWIQTLQIRTGIYGQAHDVSQLLQFPSTECLIRQRHFQQHTQKSVKATVCRCTLFPWVSKMPFANKMSRVPSIPQYFRYSDFIEW